MCDFLLHIRQYLHTENRKSWLEQLLFDLGDGGGAGIVDDKGLVEVFFFSAVIVVLDIFVGKWYLDNFGHHRALCGHDD